MPEIKGALIGSVLTMTIDLQSHFEEKLPQLWQKITSESPVILQRRFSCLRFCFLVASGNPYLSNFASGLPEC